MSKKSFLPALSLLLIFTFSMHLPAPANNNSNCADCIVPTGLTATAQASGEYLLNWNAVPNALSYTVEVEDEQNIPSTFQIEVNTGTNSYTVGGLQSGVLYKFKVRTQCAGDKSDWSEWVFFTGTGSNGGGNGGSCGTPVNLAVLNPTDSSATLTWDTVAGAQFYTIEVEDEQNVPSNFHLETSASTNSFALTGLQVNVLYKFKVKAHCSAGVSNWSGWLFFNGTNGGGGNGGNGNGGNCANPSGLNIQNLSATTVTLVWDAVSGAAGYTVEIERDVKSGGQPWQITANTITNSLDVTGLDPNKRYKFKVRTNCGGGQHSGWSKRFKFKMLPNFGNDQVEDRNAELSAPEIETHLWPNPANTEARLRVTANNPQTASITVYALNGQVLDAQTIQLEAGANEIALPLERMKTGLYLIQTRTADQTLTQKLVVQK